MKWLRRIGIGIGVIAGLVVIAGIGVWIWKPWVPPIVVSDPGPGGRRVTDGGMLANYYPGAATGRRPAIIVIGGSEGGIGEAVDREAQALAKAGFVVLNLSYFRGAGQPPELEDVPLETFAYAIDWLARQPEVDPGRIGIIGGSKGAEAALLVASRDPRLRAIVAGMPSHVVWAGFDWATFGSTASSWSTGGKPIAFLPFGTYDWKMGGRLDHIYIAGLKKLAEHPDAIIRAERIAGPILLVCGERDSLWPSCPMARQVEQRAARMGGPAVTVLAYPDAGHAVMGLPRNGSTKGLGGMGGSDDGNNAARRDSWPRIMAFLKNALAPVSPAAPIAGTLS